MTGPWRVIDGPAGTLRSYTTSAALASPPAPVLVMCHEFPRGPAEAADPGKTYPPLAERLAHESGFRVVVGMLRGAGGSNGDFSGPGWREDLDFLVDREVGKDGPVWLIGFGLGGALALRKAAEDQRVRGVGTISGPADLSGWLTNVDVALEQCRRSGAISSVDFPADVEAWKADLIALRPMEAASMLGGRPLLVVHGSEDEEIPIAGSRALADAAGESGPVDLRIVPGAGHLLRADPRVVATVAGWMVRQR